jgi:Nucleotidyltransferase/WYL domain
MEDTFEREVLPLFIEPNPTGHSCYLIAWDPKPDAPRSYKVERISAVRVLDVRFDPPMGFSIGRHLAHAWGVWTSEQPVQVELRFSPSVARRVKETTWHESQEVEDLPDGSVRVRLVVAEPDVPWQAKDQALVHTWYERRFGHPVEPLTSLEDAVSTWPEFCTSVAVRLGADGDLDVIAPLGLEDLFGLWLRRNPRRVSPEIFNQRLASKRIEERWPGVTIC